MTETEATDASTELDHEPVTDGGLADQFLAVSLPKSHERHASVYLVGDTDDGEIRKRKVNSNGAVIDEFAVSAAQFAMYARIGVHHVIGFEGTEEQALDIAQRLKRLGADSAHSFAADHALAPPA